MRLARQRLVRHPRPAPWRLLPLGLGLALALALPGAGRAQVTDVSGISALYDKVLTLQPYQVCDTTGTQCPTVKLFQDQLLRTLAQAGIATAVLPTRTLYNGLLNGERNLALYNGTPGARSSNWNTLNAWFVPTLDASNPAETLFGLGYLGGNGVAINAGAVNAADRRDTLVHEVGHNLGLSHDTLGAGAADNLMTRGTDRTIPASGLTANQIATMRASPFLQAAPLVTLDFSYDPTSMTTVTVRFLSAPEDVHLRSLRIDLPDYDEAPPAQLPASFNAVAGILGGTAIDASIAYTENMQTAYASRSGSGDVAFSSTNGGPELVIDFGPVGMEVGQTLSFEMGVHGNLRGEYAYVIGRDLFGSDVEFAYDFGLTGTVPMLDSGRTTDSRTMVAILPSMADPTPFGRQLLPGEIGPTGPVDIDPVLNAVPEPGTALLALAGGVLLAARLRRRARG